MMESDHGKGRAFLQTLEQINAILTADKREYRDNFAMNYQALFTRPCQYRIEIFDAIHKCDTLRINGVEFEFDYHTKSQANSLLRLLESLIDVRCPSTLVRALITLTKIDKAWSSFEEAYIIDLMRIERESKSTVEEVIEKGRAFDPNGHPWHDADGPYQEVHIFLETVNTLDTMVNCSPDLYVETPEIIECLKNTAIKGAMERVLHRNLHNALCTMHSYICGIGIEWINPYLARNPCLVEVLMHWKQCCQMCHEYAGPRSIGKLHICEGIIANINQMQMYIPEFSTMLQDMSPDLFIYLPRVLWMQFIDAPASDRAFIYDMIPDSDPVEISSALDRMRPLYRQIHQHATDAGCSNAMMAMWSLFIDQTIRYEGTRSYGGCAISMDGFLRELGIWSTALQRCRPEQWNTLCRLLRQAIMSHRSGQQYPPLSGEVRPLRTTKEPTEGNPQSTTHSQTHNEA